MRGSTITLLGGFLSVANAEPNIFNTASLSIGTFIDWEVCYSAIDESISDNDGNQKMNQEEYVDFLKAYGPDEFLEEVTSFEELPLIFTTNFYFLACLCDPDVGDECVESCVGSNAGLETNGVQPGDNPSEAEQSYLFLVCSQTKTSIDRFIQSISPTITPVPFTPPPTQTDVESLPPSNAPVDDDTIQQEAIVSYQVGVNGDDTSFDDYDEQLIGAMDSLAPTVLQEMGRRQLRMARELQIDPTIFLPTSIVDHEPFDCPSNLAKPADRCEEITVSITVFFQPTAADPGQIVQVFQDNLSKAIFDGELEEFLETPFVFIVDKNMLTTVPSGGGTSGAGITVGVIVGVALVAAIAYFVAGGRRGGEPEELEPTDETKSLKLDGAAVGGLEAGALGSGLSERNDDTAVDPNGMHVVGTNDLMIAGDSSVGGEMSNFDNSGDASSSNAGSSGWSSSAGIDSMNTGSADGLDFEKTIPAIATTLPLVSRGSPPGKGTEQSGTIDPAPQVTRDDLDSAIEAGDWAAVGATAALLAAASDSQSFSSKSEQYTGTRSRSGSSVSSLDVARAAELDHLVDAGDWEGVVLAAAKYEGDESKDSLPSASISGSDTRSNADTAGQTADSSVGSSKGLKRQEYRAIVEDLVQRVVPEEIENVDEMMLQFRGREDELVETLRAMQERAVAQKARSNSQRAAKQQAKLTSAAAKAEAESSVPPKSSKSIGTGQVSAAMATAKSLGTGEIGNSKNKKEHRKEPPRDKEGKVTAKETHSALEAAIEAGDWDAVGEAAAMLTDSNSLTSADTDEINKYADGVSTDGSSAAGSKNLADVADELEELIEAGDWKGVVQAASTKGAQMEKKPENTETRRIRRLKHLQEEQEALAQAEIWSAIAEQSKQESERPHQGAADAADWAISRSLNALVEAELAGINDQSTVGTDGDSLQQSTTKGEDGTEYGNEV
mmetsp:Transcript_23767/g.65923  ORF Transcript_23767/g.65923 Transcript_23767/m.65923 type:complete len:951 (+) Transcript_23767:245-3097(+)